MLQPEFLPFTSINFTREQALLAGAYLLDLDLRTGFGNETSSGSRISLVLTGSPEGTAQRTRLQHDIVSKVANTLGGFIGDRRQIVPGQIIQQICETIGA